MLPESSVFVRKKTLNCRGRLVDLRGGKVMGILNVTPDSFYDGGNYTYEREQLSQVERMINDGATFIDIGGYSTRPGADDVSLEDELRRVIPTIETISKNFPEAILSIDTFRSVVAERAIELGVSIINDITGGGGDAQMYPLVSKLKTPYILMHIQGTPKSMHQNPYYEDITKEMILYFSERLNQLKDEGVDDIIIDPGFGFGKSIEHNYEVLKNLHLFSMLEQPILVGVSRKSMINKVLHINPENSLNGTSIVNTLAAVQGCDILRVHDVKEAVEVLKIVKAYKEI